MIKKKLLGLFLMIPVCLSPAASQSGTHVGIPDVVFHTVCSGESISLICIDYYGRFRGSMRDVIQNLNPDVENLDELRSGTTLKIPRPREASNAESGPTKLFVRNTTTVQGVVTYVEGEAFLFPGADRANSRLRSNTIVYPGDVIETTRRGRVELIMNREIVVRMDGNSRIRIDSFRNKKQSHETSSIQLAGGSVWTKVKEFSNSAGRFQLKLPSAVARVHGTVYDAVVKSAGETELRVYKGTVSVAGAGRTPAKTIAFANAGEKAAAERTNENWTKTVRSNQRLTIDELGRVSDLLSVTNVIEGGWEAWNENRDTRISQLFLEKTR